MSDAGHVVQTKFVIKNTRGARTRCQGAAHMRGRTWVHGRPVLTYSTQFEQEYVAKSYSRGGEKYRMRATPRSIQLTTSLTNEFGAEMTLIRG